MKAQQLQSFTFVGLIATMVLMVGLFAFAQSNAGTAVTVPHLITFNGVLVDGSGHPKSGMAGVTFALYRDPEGGAPLWLETQNVHADNRGNYTVLLGSTKSEGLPTEIFTTGDARWLGVQVQGQKEQPRVLLASSPYALKAGDAETLGGKPASAFLTSAGTGKAASNNSGPGPLLTGTGTANHITKWITSTKIGNSGIFETGGNVGIGTTSPAAKFDLNGKEDVRDTLTLFPTGSDPTLSVSGTAFQVSNNGTVSFVSGQTFPGTGTITGVTAGTDLTGGGNSGNVTLNLDTTKVPQLSTANTNTANQTNNGTLFGQTGSFSGNTSGVDFTVGNANASGVAILGVNQNTNGSGVGVQGNGPNGVVGNGTTRGVTGQGGTIGVEGGATGSGGIGVSGTGNTGVLGTSSGSSNNVGVEGTLTGTSGGIAVWGNGGSSGGLGVFATGGQGIVGVGESTNNGTFGVYGGAGNKGVNYGVTGNSSSVNGTGLYGWAVSTSGAGVGCCPVGVWGDTGSNAGGAAGLVGTANDARAIYLANNSPSGVPTAFMFQGSNGQLALQAGGNGGSCTVDWNGHLACAHDLSVVASVDSGQRQVALYAMESPQNWFEDFGSGQLASGAARVSLESTFSQTVDAASDYHVFLTPKGECRGLYVTHETAEGFEVRELGGGTSNVAFDYRIVALRRGFESLRMEDMTERLKKLSKPMPELAPEQRNIRPVLPPLPSAPAKSNIIAPVKLSAQR